MPIVQAPIGSATTPELAAEVANAGALGTLALSWTPVERVAERVRATRALTKKAFAVNLVLPWPQSERLGECLEAGARIVSTAWGDPAPYTEMVHEAGALHLHMVGSASEAVAAVEVGVDAVVAQGWEAGGHVRGDVTTMALVPAIVDAVDPVPVIAAGGIADGRGVMAALALGASGAWIGTRFLAATETRIHEVYRERVLAASETDTCYSRIFNIGWDAPHRTLRNSTITRWEEAGRPEPGARPGEGEVIAHGRSGEEVVRYSDVLPLPHLAGNVEALPMYAGQGVALVRAPSPASRIISDLVAEAQLVKGRLA